MSKKKTGPLYLRPLPHPEGAVWYSKQLVGINTINQYMKDIAEKAGLDSGKNITNHSTHKTLVKLKKAGVDGRNNAASREWHICTRSRLLQLIAIHSCY